MPKPELEQQIIFPKNWNNLSAQEQKEWINQYFIPKGEQLKKPLPITTPIEFSETLVRDEEGRWHKVCFSSLKAMLRMEKEIEVKKEKDPDLVYLCSVDRDKIYYNKLTDQFVAFRIAPDPLPEHPYHTKVESAITLERHDFETMLALGLLHQRGFKNPFPAKLYIRKRLKRKMRRILNRFHE